MLRILSNFQLQFLRESEQLCDKPILNINFKNKLICIDIIIGLIIENSSPFFLLFLLIIKLQEVTQRVKLTKVSEKNLQTVIEILNFRMSLTNTNFKFRYTQFFKSNKV